MTRNWLMAVLLLVCLMGGCGRLRFAPGEAQKQNAYLHHRTVVAAAEQTRQEDGSEVLQTLMERANRQSEAMLAYYGLPEEIPPAKGIEEILSAPNEQLTQQARAEALSRPDPFDVADHVLELGIALAGMLGGVCGTRVVGGLKTARQKTRALQEIVQGNELFKQKNPLAVEDFKEAQSVQSENTRRLVVEMK